MSLGNPNILKAAARFTVGSPPSIESGPGFSGIVRNGAGDYTLTTDEEIDTDAHFFALSERSDGSGLQRSVTVTGPNSIQVRYRDLTGVLADPSQGGTLAVFESVRG